MLLCSLFSAKEHPLQFFFALLCSTELLLLIGDLFCCTKMLLSWWSDKFEKAQPKNCTCTLWHQNWNWHRRYALQWYPTSRAKRKAQTSAAKKKVQHCNILHQNPVTWEMDFGLVVLETSLDEPKHLYKFGAQSPGFQVRKIVFQVWLESCSPVFRIPPAFHDSCAGRFLSCMILQLMGVRAMFVGRRNQEWWSNTRSPLSASVLIRPTNATCTLVFMWSLHASNDCPRQNEANSKLIWFPCEYEY